MLSGPSGAGKGSVRRRLLERMSLRYGVSATTRKPRPGEVDGREYCFLSRSEFERRIEAGEFIEWAEVYGNLYGTPQQPLLDWLTAGVDVVVEKDVQGASTLRQRCPFAVLVFIMPPTLAQLEQRVRGRGTEDDAQLGRRLARAAQEMEASRHYDYVIVNDDLEECVQALAAVVTAERHRAWRVGAAGDESGGEKV